MPSISIINRLRLLLSVPMFLIVLASLAYGYYLFNQMNTLQTLHKRVDQIKYVAVLIHELQSERSLSTAALTRNSADTEPALLLQRDKVNLALRNLRGISDSETTAFKSSCATFDTLERHRRHVDKGSVRPIDSFDYYTRLISQMRSDYLAIVLTVSDVSLRNDFQAYTNLMAIKETLSQMQSLLNTSFSQKRMGHELYVRLILSKGEHDTAAGRFETLASKRFRTMYRETFKGPEIDTTYRMIDLSIRSRGESSAMVPAEWLRLSAVSLDKLRISEKHNFAVIEDKLHTRIFEAREYLVIVIALLSLTIGLILWMGYRIADNIRKNFKLLDEYKNAVDRSSIVSKTDKKGRITYANEKFCAISGFSHDELIGKPHSMVRHKDMPKQTFKDMWATIIKGDPWHGVVKNRTKEGSYYWVDATINPILDHKGNIEEFIAIRSDITETIRLHEELEQTQQEMISRIGEIGETRSRETGYHVRRVAEYSRLLAQKYGLDEEETTVLANASPMHDIGKVGIPDHILNKPGPLTSEEWEVMRTHCRIGYDLFRDSSKPLLKAASIIAFEHHEKYDGSGYPRGLKGEEIHIFGRITAVADVFDALGSDRCYKKAWELDDILALLKTQRGTHFDPMLIDIFFEHLDEFLAIRDAYTEKSHYSPAEAES
ncbi:MAG: nitrate- and nitrite sensing domain-containing protein [Sulfuricurvum sp.]|nr:nitrate- and nitrite sensing domain-containing protein [Sulfuricurvum sp.]